MAGREKDPETGLTLQQEKFCQAYMRCMNASQAAEEAGYSKNGVHVTASQLLRHPNIKRRISELQQTANKRIEIDRDFIVQELLHIAKARMNRVSRWNESGVSLVDSDELSDADVASVQEVSETMNQHGGSRRVKQYDRMRALELLAKMGGHMVDKVEHSGSISLESLIAGSREDDEKGKP